MCSSIVTCVSALGRAGYIALKMISPKHSKRDYASQEEQLLVVVGDGGNDHATGGMARTGNVDPKWPASSGGTVNLEDLEEPHNNTGPTWVRLSGVFRSFAPNKLYNNRLLH